MLDIRGLIKDKEEIDDKVAQALLERTYFHEAVMKRLMEEGATDFLKVDWEAMKRRIRRG